MRTFSFKFLFTLSALFISFSLLLYFVDISPLYFPHISIFFTLITYEKNRKKRFTTLFINALLFTQLAEPFSLLFTTLLFIQLYFFNKMNFDITTFDMPFIAFFSSVISNIIINLNIMAMLFITSKQFFISDFFLATSSSTLILIYIFIRHKEFVKSIYIRDTWL